MNKKRRKLPYPRNQDILEAIIEVLYNPLITPDAFPLEVKEKLKSKGFFTGLVTTKRIWQVYEKNVRQGTIPDVLGVVKEENE